MSPIDRALVRLEEVVDAAGDPLAAYVIRSRVQRLAIAATKVISVDLNMAVRGPTEIQIIDSMPTEKRRLAEIINAIVGECRHLSQRSECMDARWQEGWGRLQRHLTDLRTALLDARMAGS